MKKATKFIINLVVLLFLSLGVAAQVPQGFNFQAVATSTDGVPLSSQEIGVQIEVVKGTEDGEIVYTETHLVTTNPTGLFQIVIGEGVPADGNNFESINWANDNYFVGFGVDLTTTGSFESLGKTRLLSVPYALLAQDVVNGGSGGSGELITEINLDAATDTAFTVTMSGDEGAVNNSAIIGEASTSGANIGVEGKAYSQPGSEDFQVGTYGEAGGEGTGTHVAVFGSAVEEEGTGGRRYGLYGQALSKGRENIGGFGIGLGDGDGEIVLRGDEFAGGDFNIGGFNVGMIGFARQNLNGNIGIRGYVYGENGARSNRALQAEARTTATGVNIGMQALVSGSLTENIGIEVDVYDETDAKNLGTVLNVGGSTTSNVGLIVNADTAAMLNGATVVNGDLIVNGLINGESGSGSGGFTDFIEINTDDESKQDSLTIIRVGSETEDEFAFGLNAIGLSSGRNRAISGQIQEDASNNASQYAVSGRADGLGGGTHIGVLGSSFNSDAVNGGTRYGLYGQAASQSKFNFGAFAYSTGAGSGELVAIGDEVDGNFGSFNIGYGTYVDGNPNGNTGLDIAVGGDQGSRINIGAEARVFTTSAAENSGIQTFVNGSSTLNRGFFGFVNGDNNNVGMDITVEGGTSNIGLIVGADTAGIFYGKVDVHGNANVFGTLTASVVTETSDVRLKTNIQPIAGALHNTLSLRGVKYNWKDESKSKDGQIGVIAQEVEAIYPELVYTDDDGMKSVNYSQMVAVLIEAVKELNNKIEVLESENSELRAQLDDIEDMKSKINHLMLLMASPQSRTVSADK